MNLPVNAIVRLPHPWSRDSQGQKTFLAPSADKQTRNCHIESSSYMCIRIYIWFIRMYICTYKIYFRTALQQCPISSFLQKSKTFKRKVFGGNLTTGFGLLAFKFV